MRNQDRENIYKAIDTERDYQIRRWGETYDEQHTIADWLLFIEVQLNEAKLNYYNGKVKDATDNMRKIAALVVAYGEQGEINDNIK